MIIQGKTWLPLGLVNGWSILIDGVYQPAQPFVVLRVASKADYLAYVAETGKLDQIRDLNALGPYFYEITTD